MGPPNPLPHPLFLTSFQVPWFETIPIAVSNDISEQSLEEFSREVRWLLTMALAEVWGGCESPGTFSLGESREMFPG